MRDRKGWRGGVEEVGREKGWKTETGYIISENILFSIKWKI